MENQKFKNEWIHHKILRIRYLKSMRDFIKKTIKWKKTKSTKIQRLSQKTYKTKANKQIIIKNKLSQTHD